MKLKTVFELILNRPKMPVVIKEGSVILNFETLQPVITGFNFEGSVGTAGELAVFKKAARILSAVISIKKQQLKRERKEQRS